MKLNRQQIQTLVQQVAVTNIVERDCEEMMEAMTAYAAKLARGETIELADDELIQHHLDICPECFEEFEMIREIAGEGRLGED